MRNLNIGRLIAGLERRVNALKSRALIARLKYAGSGCRIEWPFTIWNPGRVSLGNQVQLHWQGWIYCVENYQGRAYSPEVSIGDATYIGPQCHIVAARRIEIGAHVLIAARCYISDNTHEYQDVNVPIDSQPLKVPGEVYIGDETWIGENVCIFGNVRIGRHSVIGANAVVTRSIPDYCVAVGNPARIFKRYNPRTMRWEKTDTEGNFLSHNAKVVLIRDFLAETEK